MKKIKPKPKLNMKKIGALILLLFLVFSLFGAIVSGLDNKNIPVIPDTEVVAVVAEANEITIAQDVSAVEVVEETIAAIPQIEETYVTKYTTTGVNIRLGPGTNYDILKAVNVNTELQVVENSEQDNWVKIKYADNDYYINSKYLSDEKTIIKSTVTSRGVDVSQRTSIESSEAAAAGDFVGYFTLTYYCPCAKCCGKQTGITAWGTKATAGRTIAASSKYAFGTKLVINGHTYVVEDRGGAINGNKIDVYVDSHSEALALGVKRNVPVYYGQ